MRLWARLGMTVGVLAVLGALGWSIWRLYTPASDVRAVELLRAAVRALHQTPVKGAVITRVRLGEEWREARAQVHRGAGRAQVRYLDGPAAGTTIFRQGRDVWAVREGGQPLRRVDLPDDPTDVLTRYLARDGVRARIRGERVIAGRPALLIEVGGPRGHVTLGVDRQTNFPLLMERYDAEGQLRVATVYETVDFSVQPPASLEPPDGALRSRRGGERYENIAQAKGKVSFALYQPSYIPSGFALQGVRVHSGRMVQFVTLRYSDGVNWVVVLQRPEGAEPGRAGWPRGSAPGQGPRGEGRGRHEMRGPRGLLQMRGGPMGDAIRRSMDGTVVLVMGSVPRDQLARIADSLRPVP